MHRKFGLAVGVLFVLMIGFAAFEIFFKPQNPQEDSIIIIPKGVGVVKITQLLLQQKAVQNGWSFRVAAKVLGVENKLKHGKFLIPKRSNNVQILRLLKAGRPFEELITIPEGVTSRKIASILHRRVNMDSVAFMRVVQDSAFAHQLGIEANSLEGYLFPNTYRFYWEIEPRVAAKIMVEEFFRQLPDSAEARARKMGFTLHQMVTLASIIEGEAVVDSERTIISAVYHNRLRKGILLQADPTIQFIIPDGPRRLLKADLQIDSPYNTYKYPGLPPGPINNPGKKSIEAALAPAEVPYLYFVARGDGSHVFSASYSQHRRAKRAFDRIRREVERKQKQQEHTQ